MDLKTNMEMFGKRDPWLGKYKVNICKMFIFELFEFFFFTHFKVGVTKDGLLKYVDMDLFAANGWNICQSTMCEALPFAQVGLLSYSVLN